MWTALLITVAWTAALAEAQTGPNPDPAPVAAPGPPADAAPAVAVAQAPAFRIEGGGWGHGVGMSQYGAYGRAQRGETAEQILGFYYQGTQVQALPMPAGLRIWMAGIDGGNGVVVTAGSQPITIMSDAGPVGWAPAGVSPRITVSGGAMRVADDVYPGLNRFWVDLDPGSPITVEPTGLPLQPGPPRGHPAARRVAVGGDRQPRHAVLSVRSGRGALLLADGGTAGTGDRRAQLRGQQDRPIRPRPARLFVRAGRPPGRPGLRRPREGGRGRRRPLGGRSGLDRQPGRHLRRRSHPGLLLVVQRRTHGVVGARLRHRPPLPAGGTRPRRRGRARHPMGAGLQPGGTDPLAVGLPGHQRRASCSRSRSSAPGRRPAGSAGSAPETRAACGSSVRPGWPGSRADGSRAWSTTGVFAEGGDYRRSVKSTLFSINGA